MRAIQTITVRPAILAASEPLWPVIEALWPVGFTDAPVQTVAGRILDAASPADGACPNTLILPPNRAGTPAAAPCRTEIVFADEPAVPWPFRGRRLATRLAVSAAQRALGANEQVLARTAEGVPLWSVDCSGAGRVYRSSLALPDIAPGQTLAQTAGGERFIQVLPLWHFVREVSAALGHELPPLRASFIVDDPNLHWPSYGYADFGAIARHAARENYHVAFGTIPLDTWYTHRGAAALFRAQARRLSLLVHGNDHGRNELARAGSSAACATLLRQAITRIEALERKSGVPVSRVMVPPHGACSADMLAQLPGNGFEAACVSVGSLLACNPDRAWTRSIGFAPADLIESCPVLPRWSLTEITPDVLLSAAYLGQALILRAHHQDLKDGLDVFGDAARRINSLGAVRWGNLGELARLNLRSRLDGPVCRVRPIGTALTLDVPPGTRQVIVEGGPYAWRAAQAGQPQRCGGRYADLALNLMPSDSGQRIELARVIDAPVASAAPLSSRRTPSSLILRRLLTEARDRLLVR